MGSKCHLCDCSPGPFYIWSSSRNFPREKLLKKYKNPNKYLYKLIKEGVTICYSCYDKLKDNE